MHVIIVLSLLSAASAQLLAPVVQQADAAAAAHYLRTLPAADRTEYRDLSNQYSERYDTHDGQIFISQGQLKPTPDGRDYVLTQEGSYQFISPEGLPFQVKYIADENGFQPTGAHINVPKTI